METKYKKLTLGNGETIFVRMNDYKKLLKSIKEKKTKDIVKATLAVTINSPEGITKLAQGIHMSTQIMTSDNPEVLKSLRDLIDYRLKILQDNSKLNLKTEGRYGKV